MRDRDGATHSTPLSHVIPVDHERRNVRLEYPSKPMILGARKTGVNSR